MTRSSLAFRRPVLRTAFAALGASLLLGLAALLAWDRVAGRRGLVVPVGPQHLRVEGVDQETVRLGWNFRNVSGHALSVREVKTSCGCILPSFSTAPIPQGAEGSVSAVATFRDGPNYGSVIVLFDDESVSYEGRYDTFGRVRYGLHVVPDMVRSRETRVPLHVTLRLVRAHDAAGTSAADLPTPVASGSAVVMAQVGEWRQTQSGDGFLCEITVTGKGGAAIEPGAVSFVVPGVRSEGAAQLQVLP